MVVSLLLTVGLSMFMKVEKRAVRRTKSSPRKGKIQHVLLHGNARIGLNFLRRVGVV